MAQFDFLKPKWAASKMTTEDRARQFWLLPRQTIYSAWDRCRHAYAAFVELLEQQCKEEPINAAVSKGWTDPIVGKQRPRDPMANAHATFHTLDAVEIPPGTTLYRIVDPSSSDNSIFWMSKAEFDQLQSKDDWRRRFAVWKHWNSNGEYVTYVVPPGKPLKVWEGVTASQQLQEKSQFFLAGGARQIVIEPSDLDKAYMGKRQATGWGLSDGMTTEPDFTGLPSLINYWRE